MPIHAPAKFCRSGADRMNSDEKSWDFGDRTPPRRSRRKFRKTVQFSRVVVVSTQDEATVATHDRTTLAVVAHNGWPKWVAFQCPCGCSDVLRINVSRTVRPSWRMRIGRDGTLSLFPSVDRRSGCKAHFILTKNTARLLWW
jgi:hypothetical protein